MTENIPLLYQPNDSESEKASTSYLMSMVAIMAGFPFPIINVIATLIFYFGNKRSTPYVRWHCTQALLSQLGLLMINTPGYYWAASIFFGDRELSNSFIAYVITIFLFNLMELAATIYAAINIRKGKHVEWWLFGPLTQALFSH